MDTTREISSPPETLEFKESEAWSPPPPPTDLIFDDGEPLESNRHRIAMNVLIEAVHQAYRGREDYFVGGNMFVYYSSEQARNRDFKGPDFFVTLNVDSTRERQGWVVWEEAGRYPDVIVELMSPSTARQDRGEKKQLYEQTFRTSDYFIYDPFTPQSLQGWHLGEDGSYHDILPNPQGHLWCARLGLWLGLWQGKILKETAPWLRFYDAQGHLILLGEELAQQERERAEQERERAEQERERAEQERERAEQERERAEQAERALQQLQARLQALGIDPEQLSPD
ncbi:Uma2 family endonuclease [Spirulina subsalsa]|uniref:Uma2 family endonuclease n=1 Tax=Spirulina subsalsa TaxID=54311 RepID=UPI0002E9AABB|nr:Uma2 family endonuclease [Spirulina subsalsa]